MKFSSLSSILIATVCLAADNHAPGAPGVVQCTPELALSCNGWDKDLAMAFALGQALGKQCNTQHSISLSASATEECQMIKLNSSRTGKGNWKSVKIVMKTLQSAISANFEGKAGINACNPFSELFNIVEIQNPANYKNKTELKFKSVRRLFAKYAKNAMAMITIDVALLKWFVHLINTNPQTAQKIEVDSAIFMPLCALSMYPSVAEHCQDDILTVLNQFHYYADNAYLSYSKSDLYTPSLLTLFKFLDDGPIRKKVEEIIISMLPIGSTNYLNSRMLLGDDQQFVKSVEKKFAKGKLSTCEASLHRQAQWNRKVYSIGDAWITSYETHDAFIQIYKHTHMSAIIEQGETLKWTSSTLYSGDALCITNETDPNPKQVRLFILCQLPAPDIFWQAVTSCKNLPMFQDLMTKSAIKQMILSYDITILESSSSYISTPATNGH